MGTTTLGSDMPTRTGSKRWLALLVRTVLVLLLALTLHPSAAHADDVPNPPPSAVGTNPVGACLGAEQVWLLVVDVDGEVLANQCVGTPSSGEEALARGGMQIRFSKGRLICSLSGHPEQCPATFTGSYWNYHHGAAGEPYSYAKEGASSRRPAPGGIEAWCYNAPDQKSCEPPPLTIISGGQQVPVPGVAAADYIDPPITANEAVPVPASTPWALIGTAAVILVGVLAMLWWRRHTGSTDDQVGGR